MNIFFRMKLKKNLKLLGWYKKIVLKIKKRYSKGYVKIFIKV